MEWSPQVILQVIGCVCFALCVASAALAVVRFRKDDIPAVMADLSGKAKQESKATAARQQKAMSQLAQLRSREESLSASGSRPKTTLDADAPSAPREGQASGAAASAAQRRASVAAPKMDFSQGAIDLGAASKNENAFQVVKSLVFAESEDVIPVK